MIRVIAYVIAISFVGTIVLYYPRFIHSRHGYMYLEERTVNWLIITVDGL